MGGKALATGGRRTDRTSQNRGDIDRNRLKYAPHENTTHHSGRLTIGEYTVHKPATGQHSAHLFFEAEKSEQRCRKYYQTFNTTDFIRLSVFKLSSTTIALSDFVGGNEQHAETTMRFDFRATRND